MLKSLVVVVALYAFCALARGEEEGLGFGCSNCITILQSVQKQAPTLNYTYNRLQTVIGNVCASLRMAGWCKSDLVPAIPQILQAFNMKLNAAQTCKQVKLCAAKREVDEIFAEMEQEEVEVSEKRDAQKNNIGCGVCLGIVDHVEDAVANNASVSNVTAAFKKICLAVKAGPWCDKNVVSQIPNIMPFLAQKATPQKICSKLHLCSSTSPPPVGQIVQKRGLELKCTICQSVINFARQEIGSDKTQAGVEKALHGACDKVKFAGDVCKQLLAPLLNKIVSDLVNNVDTNHVCINARFCKS
jgi:saposin